MAAGRADGPAEEGGGEGVAAVTAVEDDSVAAAVASALGVATTRLKLRRQALHLQAKGKERGKEGALAPWTAWRSVFSCAREGDAVHLKKLVESDGQTANKLNVVHETPLHLAARMGHETCVRILVELGAQSFANDRGETPVALAVANGHAGITKFLCAQGHRGSDKESVEQLLSLATTRKDTATSQVLQMHLDPALVSEQIEMDRLDDPFQRRLREEIDIRQEAERIRNVSALVPPDPPPELGPCESWTPEQVQQWVAEVLVEEQLARIVPHALSRAHVSGRVLNLLMKSEVLTLFQRIGFPTPVRLELIKRYAVERKVFPRFGFTELRNLPLALGTGAAFRIIGTVRAAMSTPVHTCRRFVTTSKDVERSLPGSFQFVTMQNVRVPRVKEESMLVAQLGFVVIITPEQQAT